MVSPPRTSRQEAASRTTLGLAMHRIFLPALLNLLLLVAAATSPLAASQAWPGSASADPGLRPAPSYRHCNPPMTALASLDDAGAVIRTTEYTGFGSIRGGADPGTIGFAGARRDPKTGLLFLRNRVYEPALGRFLSRDPISFAGCWNHYGYVVNNPLGRRDPLGLQGFANPDPGPGSDDEGETLLSGLRSWSRDPTPMSHEQIRGVDVLYKLTPAAPNLFARELITGQTTAGDPASTFWAAVGSTGAFLHALKGLLGLGSVAGARASRWLVTACDQTAEAALAKDRIAKLNATIAEIRGIKEPWRVVRRAYSLRATRANRASILPPMTQCGTSPGWLMRSTADPEVRIQRL